MKLELIETIREFTSGEVEFGNRDQFCRVSFTRDNTRFEFLIRESSLRLALRIESDDLTLHFEFPADEVEEFGESSLIFCDSASGEQVLSLTRSEHRYVIDPILPILPTELSAHP